MCKKISGSEKTYYIGIVDSFYGFNVLHKKMFAMILIRNCFCNKKQIKILSSTFPMIRTGCDIIFAELTKRDPRPIKSLFSDPRSDERCAEKLKTEIKVAYRRIVLCKLYFDTYLDICSLYYR